MRHAKKDYNIWRTSTNNIRSRASSAQRYKNDFMIFLLLFLKFKKQDG